MCYTQYKSCDAMDEQDMDTLRAIFPQFFRGHIAIRSALEELDRSLTRHNDQASEAFVAYLNFFWNIFRKHQVVEEDLLYMELTHIANKEGDSEVFEFLKASQKEHGQLYFCHAALVNAIERRDGVREAFDHFVVMQLAHILREEEAFELFIKKHSEPEVALVNLSERLRRLMSEEMQMKVCTWLCECISDEESDVLRKGFSSSALRRMDNEFTPKIRKLIDRLKNI